MSSTRQTLVYIDGEAHWLTDEQIDALFDKPAPVGPGITAGYSEGKPGKSMAMSVHPSEIPKMNALLKAHGITGVHFDPSKRDNCVITSRKGRRQLMALMSKTRNHKVFDGDGCYGDG